MKTKSNLLGTLARPFVGIFLAAAMMAMGWAPVARGQGVNDPDLPGAAANMEVMPAGSLVIAMDPALQGLVGPFNLKAYGLVNALLHTNIPVKWAIAVGKSKDGVDLSASAQRVMPTTQSVSNLSFRGGPFIVHRDYTNQAMKVMTSFGGNVAVYRLTEDKLVDVRYTVAHKPRVAVLDDGGTDGIQTDILDEAGFPKAHYQVLHAADVSFLPVSSCFTIVTTPHFDGGKSSTNQARAIREFLLDGGNFLAQCAAVGTYENDVASGHFHTTKGIVTDNSARTFDYPNGDMAFGQFVGALEDEGGKLQDWELDSGSVLTNNAYGQVFKSGTTSIFRAGVSKLMKGKPGSVVFYLGGHSYDGSTLEKINGRRMYLNALFVPMDRPADCLINFQTDLAISVDDGVQTVTNGQVLNYTIVVTNRGPGRVLGATVRDIFPVSLGNVSWTSTSSGGATNLNPSGTGNIEATVNLPIGGVVTFRAQATVGDGAVGFITNTARVTVPANMTDSNLSNNEASDVDQILNPTMVVTPPVNQTNCPGTTAMFNVTATGTALTYQWYFGGILLGGQTTSSLVLTNVSFGNAGIYRVVVTGTAGAPITNSATLTVSTNVIVSNGPSNRTNCVDTTAIFNVSATGTGLRYQWYRGDTLLLNQTNTSLILTSVRGSNAGLYRVVTSGECGSPVTNSATLLVNEPIVITLAPTSQTNVVGSTATFTVGASGSGLVYQWYFGNALVGTNSTLRLENVTTNQAGQYCAVVSGVCGSAVTNCTILTVNVPVLVVTPPVNQTNCPGTTVMFNVTATGTALTYQWYFGASILSEQTTDRLVLTNVSFANAGIYRVVVNGAAGAPITNSATLTVSTNVIVSSGPANQTNCVDTTATFNVSATGTGLRYQWYRADSLLVNQTNTSLILTSVRGTNAGLYRVVTSGECGSPVTNSATLVVNEPIVITLAPTSQTNVVGSTATFTVGATGTGLTYRWIFNGVVVGTNSQLTLNNLTTNRAGTYCAVVSGVCGTAVTNCATLTIGNRPPVAVADSYTTLEGMTLTVVAPGLLGNDSDPDGDTLQTVMINPPLHGTLALNPDGSFTYVPAPDYFGPDSFTYRATDGRADSAPVTVTLSVTPVNDPPDFTPGTNQLVNPGTGPYAISNWATDIKAGPTNEADQVLTFTVTNNNPGIFLTPPTIGPDGTLRYTPGTTPGVAVVSVVLKDNGGTANGGVDSSAVKTFTITVNAPPTVSISSPTNNAVFIATQNITIVADAMDTDGTVTNVQFYIGTNLVSQTTNAPYFVVWTNVPAGVYELTARATDNLGLTATSSVVRITVNDPVQVVTPPVNQTNCPGTTAMFNVTAMGTAVTYQWYFGGILLGGQTTSSLVLTNVSFGNAGIYRVVVSGAAGAPITNSATLKVSTNAIVSSGPSNQTNCVETTAIFSVSATGTGLRYQWYRGDTLLLNQTNTSLVLTSVRGTNAGLYRVVTSGECGSPVTNSATLVVNQPIVITLAPTSQTNVVGSTATFTVGASGSGLVYQWYFGNALVGTNSTLRLENVTTNQAGQYCAVVSGVCGSPVTNCTTLTVNVPVLVVTPPVNQTNCPGTTAMFNVTATGTAVTYQWYYGASVLPDQRNSRLVLSNVNFANAGIYRVVVSGAAGAPITNSATLTVSTNVIVSSGPVNQTNCVDTTAIFNVSATGTGLRYQWYRAETLLVNQTNTSLVLTSVRGTNAGLYRVVTSGECGSPVTNSATLVVNEPIVITLAPTSQTTTLGGNVQFRVGATGTGLMYRWFFGNVLVGTNSELALNNVTTNQVGTYCAVVSGLCGGGVTNCVTLTISNRPPVAVPDQYTTLEGTTLTVPAPGVLGNDSDPDGDPLQAVRVSQPSHGTLLLEPNGSLVYVPAPDYFGPDSFTYKARDGKADSGVVTVSFTVIPVNDPPDFTPGPNQLVNPSTGPYAISNWATDITAGPANEGDQTLTFTVSNNNTALFVAQPTISADGTLRYTPGAISGVATVSVVLKDNGGTANGGVDSSAVKTFKITVNAPPLVEIVSPTNNAVFIATQNITIVADAMDTDGTVTNVQFYIGTNKVHQTTEAPYFVVWTNVAKGTYELTARATDNMGLTTTSSVVRITVEEKLSFTFVGPIQYDGNVDLFKQQVRVVNPTPFILEGARVLVFNLTRPGDEVHNANGTNNGTPFVQFNAPIMPGESANLTIEYSFPTRTIPTNPAPTLATEIVPPVAGVVLTGQAQRINRTVQFPSNKTLLLEFTSIINRSYAVQYTSDLITWRTVIPTITGTGKNVQWVDNGAPKTESAPAVTEKRFYRVILLP